MSEILKNCIKNFIKKEVGIFQLESFYKNKVIYVKTGRKIEYLSFISKFGHKRNLLNSMSAMILKLLDSEKHEYFVLPVDEQGKSLIFYWVYTEDYRFLDYTKFYFLESKILYYDIYYDDIQTLLDTLRREYLLSRSLI